MQTPTIFEQFAQGMGSPEQFSQWFKKAWPIPGDDTEVTKRTGAWMDSFQSLLQRAEELRQLQLEAIDHTQQRTSQLAKSLGSARSPVDTAAALQAFAQENMKDTVQYWSAYSSIVQDSEWPAVGGSAEPAGSGTAGTRRKARARATHRKDGRA